MGRLHRLPDHPYKVVAQGGKVCIVTQLGGEGLFEDGLAQTICLLEVSLDGRLQLVRSGEPAFDLLDYVLSLSLRRWGNREIV